jgi:hypothetical protein
MTHIGLVACVSQKRSTAAAAKDLYRSALFSKSRAFVERDCDSWFILSAKYGLVAPAEVIEPYEESLTTKSRAQRDEWAVRVWAILCKELSLGDQVTVLAGIRYRERLVPLIEAHGCHITVPLQGLAIGQQLQWLSSQLARPPRE